MSTKLIVLSHLSDEQQAHQTVLSGEDKQSVGHPIHACDSSVQKIAFIEWRECLAQKFVRRQAPHENAPINAASGDQVSLWTYRYRSRIPWSGHAQSGRDPVCELSVHGGSVKTNLRAHTLI